MLASLLGSEAAGLLQPLPGRGHPSPNYKAPAWYLPITLCCALCNNSYAGSLNIFFKTADLLAADIVSAVILLVGLLATGVIAAVVPPEITEWECQDFCS